MFGDHPFKKGDAITNVNRCPKCKTTEFDPHQNEFETFFDCRKCGNRWSGGSVGAAIPNLLEAPPLPGVPAPDDDVPVVQYTGASFRDPGRNFDPE